MESGLASLMAGLATELQAAPGEQPTVDAIVARAVEVVPDAEFASITTRSRRHGFSTLAASAEIAREADLLQYSLKQGPCVEAAVDADFVRSGLIAADDRWPEWGPRASSLGVGSLLSVALFARAEHIGALNLYAAGEGRFVEADTVDLALLFAVHAAHALTAARLVDGLEVAVTARHDIGVAQGILMERFDLSVDQAFDLLRRISSHSNVKLSEVAREIVRTRTVPHT